MTTELKERSETSAAGIDERLSKIERDVAEASSEAKKTRRAYGLFAVIAVAIAAANLVAVGFKLDKKESSPSPAESSAPAPAATPAPATKPAPAALGHTSTATLKEYSISPKPSQLSAGAATFKVSNAGSLKHEFVVLRTKKKASQLLKGNEADEAGNVGEIADLPPGKTKTLKLKLKAGHYALICNLPGHYKLGQRADLTVR